MKTTALASHTSPTTAQPTNYAHSQTGQSVTMSATHSLAMASDDIHHAIAATDDYHRGLQR